MNSFSCFSVSQFLLVYLLCTVPSAFGTIEIESAELGFDRIYKRDRWTPLQVVVTSHNEVFNGEINVEVHNLFSGELIQAYAAPLSLTRSDRQRRVLYIFLSGISTKLILKLISQERRIRTSQEVVPELPKQAIDLVVLALTPGRDLLSRWNGKQISGTEEGHAFVAYTDFKHLPAHWKGYDSVDLFVLRGVSLIERRISKQQQRALLDWIQAGGTLLISGGIDFRHLRGSFLESFLPVDLVALRTETDLLESMQQFGFEASSPFDLIEFKLKPDVQAFVGNESQIYIAKRSFGSGQIINLAFDYNVPPFSEPPAAGAFWGWLLQAEGRSPHHTEVQYETYRRHREKIQKLLTTLPSTNAPLIRLLAIFLVAYVLSFGGWTWWARKRKSRAYWIGGFLITVLFSCAVIVPRNFVPSLVSANRFSILSVYPERNRAHLQTYIGLIASARSETSIQFQGGAFTRPLTPTATPALQLVEAKDFQLRAASLDPWVTRAYFTESFIDLLAPRALPRAAWKRHALRSNNGESDAMQIQHHFPHVLEYAWLIDDGKYVYLGSVPPDTVIEIKESPQKYRRLPLPQRLSGRRKQFVQILVGEGLLRYLTQEEGLNLVGWTRESFLPTRLNHPVDAVDETLVILYLGD